MSKLKNLGAILASAFVVFPVLCGAENALFVLPFGAEPGAPLTHAYDYGVPPVKAGLYTMRVPSVDSAMMAIFHDIEITIEAPTKTVKRSHAERAYSALEDCAKAAQVVQAQLRKILPSPYAGTGKDWQSQSTDGRVIGGVNCRVERYLPYPILVLDITTAP